MKPSGKEEAIRSFGCTTDVICAHFDASSPTQMVFRPVYRFRVTLQEAVQSLCLAKHNLLPLEATLSFASLLKFSSIFVQGGRFFLNSYYRCVTWELSSARALRKILFRCIT